MTLVSLEAGETSVIKCETGGSLVCNYSCSEKLISAGPYMLMIDVRWNNIAKDHAIFRKVNLLVKASVSFTLNQKNTKWGLKKISSLFKEQMNQKTKRDKKSKQTYYE